MSEWFINRDGKKYGPYSTKELRAFAGEGRIQPEDKVWKDGLDAPVKALQIKGLFSAMPSDDFDRIVGEEDGSPVNTQSHFKANKEKAKAALGQGINAAQAAFKTGADRLRATFGGATKETISLGFDAFFELLAHPIQYAFGTFVLLIACALSIPGLVTVVLIPVFVLGYISYMQSILKREPASLGKFISFMRHGWDSLWHLLMLLGTFFVATAIAVAPFVIAAVILYVSVETLRLGGMQATSFLPTDVMGAINKEISGVSLGKAASVVIGLLIIGLLLTALLTTVRSVQILIYCIILMVATGHADENAKYDLVYDAVERMLLIARWQWKRLVTSGLWLVSIPIALCVIMAIAASSLQAVGLRYLDLWIGAVVYPVAVLGFVIYAEIFAVQTAMQFVDSQEAAPEV